MKLLATLSALLLVLSAPAMAEDAAAKPNVSVSGAYAYATTKVQRHGAVFMEITNSDKGDDKVIAAAADQSETIELHTHMMDGDIMMMREVEAYDLPAGETTILEPMGHHIMLMGLNAPLVAGDTFPLTLTLENQGILEVQVEVKALGGGSVMSMDNKAMPKAQDAVEEAKVMADPVTEETAPSAEDKPEDKPEAKQE